jgi:hypothetical protein
MAKDFSSGWLEGGREKRDPVALTRVQRTSRIEAPTAGLRFLPAKISVGETQLLLDVVHPLPARQA